MGDKNLYPVNVILIFLWTGFRRKFTHLTLRGYFILVYTTIQQANYWVGIDNELKNANRTKIVKKIAKQTK